MAQQVLRRLEKADDLLLIEDVASIYKLSTQTIRRELAQGVWLGPKPFDRSKGGHYRKPFRWLRADIEADFKRRSGLTEDTE